jgi:serine/threonine-protein kinase
MGLAEGELVDGRYRVVRAIAEGGMGVVYEVEHVGLKKRVALKLLRSEVADIPGLSARFEREARATSMLDHPRIVRVTDFGRATQGLYLVLDLLRGRSLGQVLEEGRLPIARAVSIAVQMLEGLTAAHAANLVHRDLKPDNVFLCDGPNGTDDVRVLDFGIAALRGDAGVTKLTQTGAVMGTPAYMAPEQAMGQAELDARVDVHAVGVMLYEMLTGAPPYSGENYNQVLHAVLVGKPTPIEALRPEVAASLCAVVARSMAPKHERYPTAEAMRAALLAEPGAEWKMPSELEVTDLRGPGSSQKIVLSPTVPRGMTARAPLATPAPLTAPAALELDRSSPVQALELDRPAPPAAAPPPPPPRRSIAAPLLAVVAVALVGGGLLVWHPWKHDAIVEIVNVAPDTQVTLDGAAIEGRRLQLPLSGEVHVLGLHHKRDNRTIRFVADHDQILDASAAPAR